MIRSVLSDAPGSMCVDGKIPARAGAGFKPYHLAEVLCGPHDMAFFEVHAENYMGAGGPPHHWLSRVRERFPVSIHGVGLSLGGTDPLDDLHLRRLRDLVERYQPGLISEHLAWSCLGRTYFNDLLPVPYDRATLDRVCAHVDQLQTVLRRRVLIENPATYLRYCASSMDESEFLAELSRRTGCGLLLDVANVHISAINHGFDAQAYVDAFPLDKVAELHLAGYAEFADEDAGCLLIDAHNGPVSAEVWALYDHVLARTGPLPTLVEWDNDIPEFTVLAAQTAEAERRLAQAAYQHQTAPAT
jgi:hypothetical protein